MPLAELELQYRKYFQCHVFPSPESVEPGCASWLDVFKTSPRFRQWFSISYTSQEQEAQEVVLIHALQVPERDLKAYFRLVCYTQYLGARQGAKIEEWSVSESEPESDEETLDVLLSSPSRDNSEASVSPPSPC